MSQRTLAGAVMLTLVVSAFAVADETKITITVDRAKPVAVSASTPSTASVPRSTWRFCSTPPTPWTV